MTQRFIPQSTIDEARDALRGGTPIEHVAPQLGVDTEYLGRLMGIRPVPEQDNGADEFCIFEAAERLEEIL